MGTTNMEVLERKLKEETDKYLKLKQLVDKDSEERASREKTVLLHSREADFIQDKIKSIGVDNLELKFAKIKQLTIEVQEKRDRFDKLRKITEEFDDIEPTNEALKNKIDDLKKSRLSLDYIFSESQDKLQL